MRRPSLGLDGHGGGVGILERLLHDGRAWSARRREDRESIPENAAFNVLRLPATAEPAGGGGVSEEALEGVPQFEDFFAESDAEAPQDLLPEGSSAGAISVVKSFNLGRDPGVPEDRTLYLTIPKLGLEDVPVYDSVSEEKLRESAVHIPATGYPWQEGANVFIAGHRVGYPGTGSYYLFFDLDRLAEGDEMILEDAAGGRYLYRVTETLVVGPREVEPMNPVEGKSVISLQTCTLPDYEERLIVRGELVEETGG